MWINNNELSPCDFVIEFALTSEQIKMVMTFKTQRFPKLYSCF